MVHSTIFGYVCRGETNDFFMVLILKLLTSPVSSMILSFLLVLVLLIAMGILNAVLSCDKYLRY